MKLKFSFFIILFLNSYILELKTDFINKNDENKSDSKFFNILFPGIIQTEFVDFNNPIYFYFRNMDISKILFRHIFSIDCQIEVELNNPFNISKITNQRDSHAYPIKIIPNYWNADNYYNNIIIKAINNKINNIKNRKCPLIINSFYNENELIVKEENPTIFFFDNNLREIKLLYDFANIKDKSFITFSFIFNEIAKFEIEISETKQKRKISNSNNIFLTNESIDKLDSLHIKLKRIDENESPVFLSFRVITNNFNPILLQKNYLNQGFITSNNNFQYYYMDIYNDEEGEIMLHDKRQNGKLIGKICKKEKEHQINIDDYNQINECIDLEFKEHIRKLNFTFSETNKCEDGCLLLIIYNYDKIYAQKNLGFEFTLLTRIWNKNDWSDTNIVNIPNNEYIFGYFDKNIINHHYYSIFVPNETDKIYIEIKGKNFQFFYGEGKRQLNTYNSALDNTKELIIENNEEELKDILEEKYKKNNLSFAIRPRYFFEDVASFYYFRVFQLKDNESLIMPLDSDIGNNCKFLKKEENCFFILKNDYNEFSRNFAVFSTYQNGRYQYLSFEKTKFDITNDITNDELNKLIKNFEDKNFKNSILINTFTDNNLAFILFEYQIINNTYLTILTSSYDENEIIFPQIYSPQMFKIENTSIMNFTFLSKYSLIINWINGIGEILNIISNQGLTLDRNNLGKPYSVLLSDIKDKSITFNKTDNFVLNLQLKYNTESFFQGEIKSGQQISEIINEKTFPIYFYYKITDLIKAIQAEIDINFKIINFNDDFANFTIEGMLCQGKISNDIYRTNYIDFRTDINGKYDISSKIGLLHISNITIFDYIMVKIDEKNNKLNDKILIQIVCLINFMMENKLYYSSYIPVNQFIVASINLSTNQDIQEILYPINFDEKEKNNIIIEFSKNYQELNIEYNGEKSLFKNGFENYEGKDVFKGNRSLQIKLNKNNFNDLTICNYLFRYYYKTEYFYDVEYEFNKKLIKKTSKNIKENVENITFEFYNLKIINITDKKEINNYIDYKIYCNLFLNQKNNELLNTSGFISAQPIAQNMVRSSNKNKTFLVNMLVNATNVHKYNYVMQIKFYLNNISLNNEILSYSNSIDLSDIFIKKKQNKYNIHLIIIFSSVILVLLLIIAIASICIIKMKNKNENLKEKVLSISFSRGNSTDILTDDSGHSKRDEEYETTFI